MGEIIINPIHNVHKQYRQVNLVNPYIFTPPLLAANTFIGGVASTISTASALATKLGISVGAISNFTIVGSDIKCRITGSYSLGANSFDFNADDVAYYIDTDKLVTSIGLEAFYATNAFLGFDANFENCATVGMRSFSRTKANGYYLKNATSLGNGCFAMLNGQSVTGIYYIPSCTTLGSTTGDNLVFEYIKSGAVIYTHPSLATNNSGSPDGDLAYAITRGATVRYVTNFTAPNAITDLAAGTIYNTAIQLNFTTPSSTNTIDYYEVWDNGVRKNNITASGQYITGLTPSTSYNITLIAVDVFYNKSVVSNQIAVSTNTTSAIPTTGLISYYKLDANSNDIFGSNNGTDTSVSYVSGKVNNAGSYNGTISKSIIGNPSNLQLSTGTVSCWIKTSNSGSSYRSIIAKNNAYGMFLKDNILMVYNWGIFGTTGDKTTGIALNDNVWHHVALIFESGTANNYLYIDGVLKLTFSMSVLNQSSNFEIGSSNSAQFFTGLIDEGNVYSTKLTQSQIQLIYNNGNGTTL